MPDAAAILNAMLNRRTAGARGLTEPGPSRAELETILTAAAAAPDHGLLVPFRFVEVPAGRRAALSEAFAAAAHEANPSPDQNELDKARAKGQRGPLLIALIARIDAGHPKIPASDQWLTVGCMLQNMVLAAEALGFGVAISSGRALDSKAMRALFKLSANEALVSFLMAGTPNGAPPPRRKPELAQILSVLE